MTLNAHLRLQEHFNDKKFLEAAETFVPVTFDPSVIFWHFH